MRTTINAFWDLLEIKCKTLSTSEDEMVLDRRLREEYVKACTEACDAYKQHNMDEPGEDLDRHKVAAILVTKGLEMGIIKRKDGRNADSESEWFIGIEKILLISAINYLVQELNRAISLKSKSLPQMKTFLLPQAFSCQVGYLDIMCRLLKEEFHMGRISVLVLSDKFFLLEYVAIVGYYGNRAEEVYELLRRPVKGT